MHIIRPFMAVNNNYWPMMHLQGRVVSAHKAVLAEVQAQAIGKGAMKVTPLAVSGAFHTPLMQPAQDSLRKVITGHTKAKGCGRPQTCL